MQRLVREETKIFKSLSFSLCSKIITIHFIYFFFLKENMNQKYGTTH
jgi:hypothetical protein